MLLVAGMVIRRVSNAIAAGTTVQTFTLDTLGYRGVMFIVEMGAIVGGAVTSAKLGQGLLSDGSDATDITGATVTISDTSDNKVFLLEVQKATKRYVTLTISRATQNATIEGVTAILQDDRITPVLQDTTIGGSVTVTV